MFFGKQSQQLKKQGVSTETTRQETVRHKLNTVVVTEYLYDGKLKGYSINAGSGGSLYDVMPSQLEDLVKILIDMRANKKSQKASTDESK